MKKLVNAPPGYVRSWWGRSIAQKWLDGGIRIELGREREEY